MRSTTLRTARELRAIKLPRVDLARLDLAPAKPLPLELPPEFKLERPAIPVDVQPRQVIEAMRGSERMSSVMAPARVFSISKPDTQFIGPWSIFDCHRPTLILQNPLLPRNPTVPNTTYAIEAMPGLTTDRSAGTPDLWPIAASGRSLILPWGGRWWLRLAALGNGGIPAAATVLFIAFEAPPGVSAVDLFTMRGSGHLAWNAVTSNSADLVAHTLLEADPDRQALIVSVSTASVGIYVTITGDTPTVANGIPLASTQPPLRFTSDDVPLGPIKYIANTATACNVTANWAYQ